MTEKMTKTCPSSTFVLPKNTNWWSSPKDICHQLTAAQSAHVSPAQAHPILIDFVAEYCLSVIIHLRMMCVSVYYQILL